jgi:hypothetical protein
MGAMVFDRVVITTNGQAVDLTEAEFFALPLTERLRAIFEKRLEFYRGRDPVDTIMALQSIRERRPS